MVREAWPPGATTKGDADSNLLTQALADDPYFTTPLAFGSFMNTKVPKANGALKKSI